MGSFGAWWSEARDRLLTRPDFRQWAAAFPPTRWVARRRARALFDLCAGFVYSQVLLACVRLQAFDHLREGPMGAEQFAAAVGLPRPAAERLLRAAVALELVEHRDGERFGLGPLGAAMVDNPAVAAMVEHHASVYRDLADPVALLKGGAGDTRLAQFWPYGEPGEKCLSEDQVAAYTRLMSDTQPLVTEEILAAFPFERHRHLLDVAGGDGTFLAAVAGRHPALQVTLFDLPAVANRAAARFEAAGIADRARAVGGSFRTDPLPRGADVVSLVRVVHDHDDPVARGLLRATFEALPPGGVLLIAEPLAEAAGAETTGDAYFGFYLLAMGHGRPRTVAGLAALLTETGFARVRSIPTRLPLQVGMVVAEKPLNRQ